MDKQSSTAFFVTGIGTDVGKTIVSAILSEAIHAHYWKPIQSGDLEKSDSKKIKEWTENVEIIDEQYRLKTPVSPHTSARIDGVTISQMIPVPSVKNHLIIEGAGGILVPINDDGSTFCDVLNNWKIPVIVVIKHYLGSINHTLLTLEYLKQQKIPIAGIVVTGREHEESEKIIETISGLSVDLHVPFSSQVDSKFIVEQAITNKEKIIQWLLG